MMASFGLLFQLLQLDASLLRTCSHRFSRLKLGCTVFNFFHVDVNDPAASGWKTVTIDDQIPCSADYLPVLGKLDDPSEMWAVMLEKAYAKFLGSYSLLHIGDTWEPMVHLTGGKCEMHNWDVEKVSIPSTCVVWWLLNENHRHGLLQTTVFLDKEEGDEGANENVRLLHHTGDGNEELVDEEKFYVWNNTACTVLQTYEFKQQGPHQGTQLVLIRNVFGDMEWNGDWSATSNLWTKEIREQMNYKNSDEYLTWIKIDDFVRQYNTLLTCFNFKGAPTVYFDTLKPVAEGGLSFHAHQYLITITDPKGSTTDQKSAQKKKPGKQAKAVVLNHLTMEDEPDAEDKLEDDVNVDMDAVEKKEDAKNAANFSFGAMKQKLTVEKTEEENTGPKFTVKLYLSQPKQDNMATVPRDISLEMFKVKGRQLQSCTFVDTEYGYNDQGEVTTYQFVQNNKLRLTEEKSETRFEMIRSSAVQPGHYVATLHQHYFRDELRYCLSFSSEDDKDLPTGYTMQVEYIGTCANPKVELSKKKAPPRTPRKTVEEKIEKQKNMM
eukprot:TRINITY_DN8505_c0_g1_i1.p1 TRINITY_DN8505_c0_g1~~TRINITY_DN8505_c0_g1_i1.p1  ORF type:complete len:550 (+),score=142.15 TRINITY_DN8505_c0_g1_i1:531-2180(+)